jgi:hypothetical protein
MGYGDDDDAAGKLYGDFLKRTEKASGIIKKLSDKIRI